MKKKLIFAVPLVLLIYFVHSCTDESFEQQLNDENVKLVSRAKEMYNGSTADYGIVSLRSASDNNGNKAVKPDWKYTSIEQNNTYQAVEVLLRMEKTFNFAPPESFEKFKSNKKLEYIQSKTSLIYLTHKKSGEEMMFLMTIIPDMSYQEYTKFDPFKKMSYLKRDNKFNGAIIYHHLNGRYANGWRYKDGKVTGTIQAQTETPDFDMVSTRSGSNCSGSMWIEITQQCWTSGYYNISGDFVANSPTNCYVIDIDIFIYLECDYSGNNNDGYYNDNDSCYPGSAGDGGTGVGNTPTVIYNGDNQVYKDLAAQINAIMPQLKSILLNWGIHLSNYQFTVSTFCGAYARYSNGWIEFCYSFMNLSLEDKAAVIYHEIYHLQRDLPWSENVKQLPFPIELSPPPDIENYIKNHIIKDDTDQQGAYLGEITIYSVLHPNFYLNEINAYKAQMSAFPNSSEAYLAECRYALWRNEQLYNIACKYYYLTN